MGRSLTLIVAAVLLLALLIVLNRPYGTPPELTDYFAERMQIVGVERIGQPVEGFDAFLYLEAYPGLLREDFHGVEALEGIYELKQGELAFRERTDEPIHSAAQTISGSGMKQLLKNISMRISAQITGKKSVDSLIEAISKKPRQ